MKKWHAILKNGKTVSEDDTNWNDIKDNISKLEFDNNGQKISLPKNSEGYIQGKTASGNMFSGECKIESRYIGCKYRNNIIKIRIDENSNNISLEISNAN
jgi:hypothetical protein